jgi:IPTL-CTERM motif
VQHNGAWLTISYTAGDGNDIVLSTVFGAPQSSRPGGYAIPTLSEWGTLLLGTLLAAGGMLRLLRRQHGGRSARK